MTKTSIAILSWCAALASAPTLCAQSARRPLSADLTRSAEAGWLAKPVLSSRVLDDMSDPVTWQFRGQGTLTTGRDSTPDGMPAFRISLAMLGDSAAPTRNGLAAINLSRAFGGADWSGYNRISVWIKPHLSGFPMLPLEFVLHNDGAVKIPDVYYREGIHYVQLENEKWTQVVWEIAPLARDKVTSLEIGYWVNKRITEPGDRVDFDIAKLELQRVAADHFAGWGVAPGRIAFSHSGYSAGSQKTAFASDLDASEFQLQRVLPAQHQQMTPGAPATVFTGPVQKVTSRLGAYQLMDFSQVRDAGTYILQAGARATRPFSIGENVWRRPTLKVINFFFGERCGFDVPGEHGVCHLDWTATLGDKKVVMNGGWHDAGDLSQGLINTGEATYALFALAQHLQARNQDPDLLRTLVEEAKWGLEWCLKVRFPGGYRIGFAGNNLWTNGIIGDADDRRREAQNNPNVNYIAAAAEAIAYRVLQHSDPELAARSLRIAQEDWAYAVVEKETAQNLSTRAFAASPMELAGIGILASLELYQATGQEKYAQKAVELAPTILAAQQQQYVGSKFPLAGFFYTGPDRQALFHQFHRGNDQAPIVALARLCDLFPDHADWMKWYSAVTLYAEYQKKSAQTTAPYGVLPSYVYTDQEYLSVPDSGGMYQATRAAFRDQVLRGMPMGEGYYLRAFPVWFARRGNFGVLLSQAKALSTAAQLRRDWSGAQLAQNQAQWIVGRNPFVQSTMWGEGYDWAQQYSVSSGDIVGALPVGMQSHGLDDVPYWPSQNTYVYKEVWVHPAARWIWLMQDIAGPALIAGRAEAGALVAFLDAAGTQSSFIADAGGEFRATLPEGKYVVTSGARRLALNALPASTHHIDLRPGRALDLTLASAVRGRDVTITLTAAGAGEHSIVLRTHNLSIAEPARRVVLKTGQPMTIRWQARLSDAQAPWVAVVVPDGDAAGRQEIVGYR